jgi:hypothetical protein
METNPLPPPPDNNNNGAAQDPWGPAPHAQNGSRPRIPPPDPDVQDDSQFDPLGQTPTPIDPLAGLGGSNALMAQVGHHACDRLAQCGLAGEPMVQSMCAMVKTMPGYNGAAPSCATAKRCLAHIDQMSCAMQTDDPAVVAQLFTQFPDCFEAMTRC